MAWPMGVSGEALVTKTRRNVQEESHHIAGFLWCCPVWPGLMLGNTMTVRFARSREWQDSAELQTRWPCFQMRSQGDAVLIVTANAGGAANEA